VQAGWRSRVFDRLAQDLRAEFPDQRGWSRRNLYYMRSARNHPDRHRTRLLLSAALLDR
jgi:hypothetical protein